MRALAAVVLDGTALPGCGAGGDRTARTFPPEMYHSVPYDAYDPNPATRSGQTLQAPPEGTVALGQVPFAFGPGPEEVAH